MTRRRTLRGRLIATHVAVVAAVVAAGFLAVRLLTPALFQQRVRARGGVPGGNGPGGPPAATVVSQPVQDAYNDALTSALLIAAVVGVALAVLLAVWLTRRVLRHLAEMQNATRRIAAGEYSPLPEPDEAELADLAGSINRLGADLAATQQTRARLVSDLAHELRNPLATIEGYMEGLIDGVVPATTDTYSAVAEEAHRLQRLTDDLSLLARAQEGALELELGDTDLAAVARNVAARLQPQYQAQNVALLTHLDQALPVRADSNRLTQAITNLLGNALTHTPPGGSVTVTASRAAGVCRIEVTDTGRGIPPDRLDAIFQRFTRLDPTGVGTGIGLNIARTIARLHDGDVTASSDGLGKGATFTLTLPAR